MLPIGLFLVLILHKYCLTVDPRKAQYKIQFAHNGIVSGLSVHPSGKTFYTCGIDKYVKAWKLDVNLHEDAAPIQPLQIKGGEEGFLFVLILCCTLLIFIEIFVDVLITMKKNPFLPQDLIR